MLLALDVGNTHTVVGVFDEANSDADGNYGDALVTLAG